MGTRGLIGSLLVLIGGWAPITGSMWGRMVVLAAVLVGLALLGSAWIRLCRDAAVGRIGLFEVRTSVAAWCVPLLVAPPMFSNDGWSYAAQGMLVKIGLTPYVWTPSILSGPIGEHVDMMWRGTPAPYGPLPLLYGGAAADLTASPLLLVFAHRLLALAGLAMLAWSVPRLARWSGVEPVLATALALGSPLMIGSGVAGLHNDVVMVGLMAVALVLGVERGWVAGAIVGGLAAAVKLPGGLACLGVVLASLPPAATAAQRLRRHAAVGAVAIGTLVLCGVPRGLGVGWVHALGVPGEVQTPLSVTTMLGRLVGDVDLLRAVGLAVTFGVLLWLAIKRPTGVPGSAVRTTTIAVGVAVALLPTVHIWYLLWVTPLAAAVVLTRVQRRALLGVGIVAGLAAPLDSSLHGLYLAIVLGSALAALFAGVLLLGRNHRTQVARVAAAS